MNNFENTNKIIEFSGQSYNKDSFDSFERIKAENARYLEELKIKAKQIGKEPFDAAKLMKLYYPNDTSDNEIDILKRVKALEMDYYISNVMSLAEFADERERYDEIKDYT